MLFTEDFVDELVNDLSDLSDLEEVSYSENLKPCVVHIHILQFNYDFTKMFLSIQW